MTFRAHSLDDRAIRVVFEALHLVASDAVAVDIVSDAIATAKLDGSPGSPEALREFVRGHLWASVASRLGAAAADVVAGRVEVVAAAWALSDSHTRPKSPLPRLSENPPSPLESGTRPSPVPTVLLVTADPGLTGDVQRAIGDGGTVTQVEDSLDLLRKLEDLGGGRLVLVVDCLASPVNVGALIQQARALPFGARVLLWRADPHLILDGIPEERAEDWCVLSGFSSVAELRSTVGRLLATVRPTQSQS